MNNIGVLSRELGELDTAEGSFRRVTQLDPDFVFGYYNLGHTLFLQGRFDAALSAYLDGQRRDPQKNAVQAARVAMVRLATGDAEGATRDLAHAMGSLPPEARRSVLIEALEILSAVEALHPTREDAVGVRRYLEGLLADGEPESACPSDNRPLHASAGLVWYHDHPVHDPLTAASAAGPQALGKP